MVQIWPSESGGKSWLKEISTGKPRIPPNCSGNDEPHNKKTPPPIRESGVLFDRDTSRGIALSLAGLAATYSPRA